MTIATPCPPAALKASATPDGTLLDAVLPRYDYDSSVAMVIHASPAEIFQALRTVTPAEMPLAYALGTIRYLPGLLSGRLHRDPDEISRPFFDVAGSRLLAETTDREMIFGCAGILHNLVDQQFVAFEDVEAFRSFERPGYEKFAQSFRIAGRDGSSGYTVVAEHRTRVLGTHARWKFALYWWLMVGWAGDLLLRMLLNNGRVSDIFLPRWLADRIPQLCGPPLLVGVLALAWHRWIAARSAGSR